MTESGKDQYITAILVVAALVSGVVTVNVGTPITFSLWCVTALIIVAVRCR